MSRVCCVWWRIYAAMYALFSRKAIIILAFSTTIDSMHGIFAARYFTKKGVTLQLFWNDRLSFMMANWEPAWHLPLTHTELTEWELGYFSVLQKSNKLDCLVVKVNRTVSLLVSWQMFYHLSFFVIITYNKCVLTWLCCSARWEVRCRTWMSPNGNKSNNYWENSLKMKTKVLFVRSKFEVILLQTLLACCLICKVHWPVFTKWKMSTATTTDECITMKRSARYYNMI